MRFGAHFYTQSGLVVVLEDPADAMNAGAVLRSCDAFGVTETWFIHNGILEGTSMRKHVESGRVFDLDSNKLQVGVRVCMFVCVYVCVCVCIDIRVRECV